MEQLEAVVCVGDAGVNGLATVRSLGRRGVPVHVVSVGGSAQIASASRYCTGRTVVDDISGLAAALLGLPGNRRVLFVDNDPMMKALAPHATALAARYDVVEPLADAARLTDKAFQLETVRRLGLAVPRTWFPAGWDELAAISRETPRRLIAKPSPARFSASERPDFKAVIARTGAELAARLRPLVDSAQDLLVQEFVEGGDSSIVVGLCYRARSRGRSFVLTGRKLRQTTPGAGIMAVGRAEDLPEVATLTRRLALAPDLYGVIATEFKQDPVDGRLYFIEWNPRPPVFQSIGRRSGYDLAWLAYCDFARPAALDDARPSRHGGHAWISVSGDCSHLVRAPGKLLRPSTWKPYFGAKEWAVFATDDLMPWIRSTTAFGSWLSRGLLRAAWARLRRAIPPAAKGRAPGPA